jgi:hypothetical protein
MTGRAGAAGRPRAALARAAALAGRAALAGLGLGAAAVLAGCGDGSSAIIDSAPIALGRAPMGGGLPGDGALVATASDPDPSVPRYQMIVDTGSPITVRAGEVPGTLQTFIGGFDLHTYAAGSPPPPSATRASFGGEELIRLPLQPAGDGTLVPGGIFGGNLLRGYSVAFRFGAACAGGARCSSMTLWPHLGADEGFLEDAGYAVYRFSLYGGGEVTAQGRPDFLGITGPLVLPATRVVLRTCAAAAAFAPSDDIPCCHTGNPGDDVKLATGVNLALLLATGVGPAVLSQSAYDRLVAETNRQICLAGGAGAPGAPPALQPPSTPTPSLYVATWPTPIAAGWATIPRLAFVDLEAGAAADPGACVELGRARRTEQVSYRTITEPAMNTCGQPCDADPRQPDLAQSSAAYLELAGGQIPVAVIADDEPFLQSLRLDVLPEGPELDGLVGAGTLGRARVEIDYPSGQTRALFSCEPEAPREECWAAPRCPRLPDATSVHYCFNLPAHRLPATCAPQSMAACFPLPMCM